MIKKEQKIVIIGAGEIGRAIEKVLEKKLNVQIKLWDKCSDKVSNQKPLTEIIPWANFVFLCVPSWAIRNVITSIVSCLNKEAVVICLAKGIEQKTLKTMIEVLEETLPNSALYGFLAGPMLAEELTQRLAGIGLATSKNKIVFEKMKTLFNQTNFKLECSEDTRGVVLASVLKNIYAIGLGIADALKLGENFKGWFLQKSVQEMAKIIEKLDGQKESAFGLAGLGDLVATGFSPYSSNRKIGQTLVNQTKEFKILQNFCFEKNRLSNQTKADKNNLKSEGIISLPSVIELLGKDIGKFSILQAVNDVVAENKNAKAIFEKLTKSDIKQKFL